MGPFNGARIDDKALATDTTAFADAFVREGKHRSF